MGEDRYAITIAVGFLMAILPTIAVILRFMACRKRKLKPRADDWIIVVALVIVLGQCVLNLVGAFAGGFGTHVSIDPSYPKDLQKEKKLLRSKLIWALGPFMTLSPGIVRISILLFYQRIFVGASFKVSTWVVFALNIMWIIGFFFANLLSCLPIHKGWISVPPSERTCVDLVILFESGAISGVLLDGLVLTLPWYPVWKSQMSIRRKLTVTGIFLLGAFVCVAGVFRTVAIYNSAKLSLDTSYNRAPAFYWCTVEAGTGIISACLPTLRPLLSKPGPGSIIRSIPRRLKRSISFSRGKLVDDESSFKRRPSDGSCVIPPVPVIHGGSEAIVFDGLPATTRQHVSAAEATCGHTTPPSNGIRVESSVAYVSRPCEKV